ncbi:MAG: META domain-containing protein [Salinisphaera sp.]|jgi:heat shock protein HslJ|nr:META domain-containing protein [Salinisphaera sp.]
MFRLLFTRAGRGIRWLHRLADAACVGLLASLLGVTIILQAGVGSTAEPTLTDTHWTLEQVGRHHITSGKHVDTPFLVLQDRGQRVHAESRCQTFVGRYTQPGLPQQLRFNLHTSDHRHCNADSGISQDYAEALARTRGETIEGSKLVLRDLQGRPLARLRTATPS